MVGLAGFEPTTSTQKWRDAIPYGFLYDRSKTSVWFSSVTLSGGNV
jgi:hypothetical protein